MSRIVTLSVRDAAPGVSGTACSRGDIISFSKAIRSYAEIFYPEVGGDVLQTPSNGLQNRLLEQKVVSVLLVKFFLALHGMLIFLEILSFFV